MVDKALTYKVQFNTAQARGEVNQLIRLLRSDLQRITLPVLDPQIFDNAIARTQTLQTEMRRLASEAERAARSAREIAAQPMRPQSIATPTLPPIGGGGGGIGGGLAGGLVGGLVGYLGSQGAQQLASQAVALAELGTQARRVEQSFQILSGGAENARRNIQAIQQASNGTVTSLQAIEIGNQAAALGLAKTAEEFENLTRAGKAITLVSPTVKDLGNALTELSLFAANEQSFARADQLGLTASEVKERMAELRAENDQLDGSQAKLAASIQLLNEKYGELLTSSSAGASGLERLRVALAEVRIETAKGPIGQGIDALIGGLVPLVEGAALAPNQAALDWNTLLGIANLEQARSRIDSLLNPKAFGARIEQFTRGVVGNQVNEAQLQGVLAAIERYNTAVQSGVPGLEGYAAALGEVAQEAARTGGLTAESEAALGALNGAVSQAITAHTEMQAATQSANSELYNLVLAANAAGGEVGIFTSILISAGVEARNLDADLAALQRRMANNAAAMAPISQGGQRATQAVLGQVGSVLPMLGKEETLALVQQQVALVQGEVERLSAQGPLAADVAAVEIAAITQAALEPFEQIKEAEQERIRAQREAEAAAKRGARENETAWKKAAAETEREFKAAAQQLKSDLQGAPGLFGTSSVTQDQMDMAALGVPQNFADDYLRRLRDEVLNNKDWADVSIEDAAARAGIDPNLPAEVILKQFEEAWRNSSLFADESNLDLINQEAVQAHLDLQERIRQGQQNILEFFGATVDTVATGVAAQKIDEIVEDQFNASIAARGGGSTAGATGGAGLAEGATPFTGQVELIIPDDIAAGRLTIEELVLSEQAKILSGGKLSIAELAIAEAAIDKFISDVAVQFANKGQLIKGQGQGVAMLHEQGYTEHERADMAGDLLSDLGLQLQTIQDAFKGQGGGIAMLHEQGYTEHEWGDIAGTTISALTKQFVTEENTALVKGIGSGIASIIDVGMIGYDFAGAATSALLSLRRGFATEDNLNIMTGMGSAIMVFVREGMLTEVNQPGWGQVIFDAVVGAVMQGASESLEG